MRHARLLAALVVLSAPASLRCQSDVILIRGATIHPASSAPIANGSILSRGGKIAAIGTAVAAPAGALIIEAAGKDVVSSPVKLTPHSWTNQQQWTSAER